MRLKIEVVVGIQGFLRLKKERMSSRLAPLKTSPTVKPTSASATIAIDFLHARAQAAWLFATSADRRFTKRSSR